MGVVQSFRLTVYTLEWSSQLSLNVQWVAQSAESDLVWVWSGLQRLNVWSGRLLRLNVWEWPGLLWLTMSWSGLVCYY